MDEVNILLSSKWKQEVKDSFLICENECREHKGTFILFDAGMDFVNNKLINMSNGIFLIEVFSLGI